MSPILTAFYVIRILFIILDIGLVVLLLYTLQKALPYRPRLKPPKKKTTAPVHTVKREVIQTQWQNIRDAFNENTAEAYKNAILSADRLADGLLKDAGLEGEHMADKLDQLTADDLASLETLWRSHRVRNQLLHDPDVEIQKSLAEETLEGYEIFLRELRLLE